MTIITSDAPLPPLFTTSPLGKPSFSCEYTTSPTSARPLSPYSQSRSSSPSDPSSSKTPSPTLPEKLSFAKIPIPSAQRVYQSTDSETVSSDWGVDSTTFSSRQAYGGSRSPSLLTCLIQGRPQPSRFNSGTLSSSSCQPTPVTPVSTGTATTLFGAGGPVYNKPILRRGSVSAYTSASEDGAIVKESGPALGFLKSALEQVSESVETGGSKGIRRSCTLKFDVTPCLVTEHRRFSDSTCKRPSTTSGLSGSGSRKREPSQPVWEDDGDDEDDEEEDGESLFVDAESESDEGYREDEEDGFTSDEDVATSVGPSRRPSQVYSNQMAWAESSDWASGFTMIPSSSSSVSRRRRHSPSTIVSESLILIDEVRPVSPGSTVSRGRKIRVKEAYGRSVSNDKEKCTRHRSPPPRTVLHSPAPPAARSPSAAELCRRRGSGVPHLSSKTSNHMRSTGWKSDDPAFNPMEINRGSISDHRKISLRGPMGCTPILKRVPTFPTLSVAQCPPSMKSNLVSQRRPSQPEILRRGSLPSNALLHSENMHVLTKAEILEERAEAELRYALGLRVVKT